MGPRLGLRKFELCPADHHLMPEIHEVGQHLLEGEGPGTSVDEGDVVDRETGLELGVFEQGVQDHAGVAALLHPDDHPDALARGFVIDVGYAFYLLVLDHLADLLDHVLLVDHVGNLGHYDGLAAVVSHFYLCLGADHHAAPSGLIGLLDAADALDDSPGREIGALDILHQAVGVDIGIVDVCADGVADLAEVVGSHVRRHAHRDSG